MNVVGYLFRFFPDEHPRWYVLWIRLSGVWSNPRGYVQLVVTFTNGDRLATYFDLPEVGSFDVAVPFYPSVVYSPNGVAGFPSRIDVFDQEGKFLTSGSVEAVDVRHSMSYVTAKVSIPGDAEDVLLLCTPATLTNTAFPHFDGTTAYLPKYAVDDVTNICQVAYVKGGYAYLATVDVQPNSPDVIDIRDFQQIPELEAYLVDHLRYEYMLAPDARDARYLAKLVNPYNEYVYKTAKEQYESVTSRYLEGDTAEDASASLAVLSGSGTFFYPQPDQAVPSALAQLPVRLRSAVSQFISRATKKQISVKMTPFENLNTKRLYVASAKAAKAGAKAIATAAAYAGTRLRSVVRLAGSSFAKALAVGALILGASGAIYAYERAKTDSCYDAQLRFCKDLTEMMEKASDQSMRDLYRKVYEENCEVDKCREQGGTDILGAIISILPLIMLLSILKLIDSK